MRLSGVRYLSFTLIIILILFIQPTVLLSKTTGKITGRVIDSQNRNPVPGVNVILSGGKLGAETDSNGDYFILNVPPGLYSLRAEIIGYKTVIQENVRISVDLTTRINFSLSIEPLKGEEIVIIGQKPIIQTDVSGSQHVMDQKDFSFSANLNINNVIRNEVSINNLGTYDDLLIIRGSDVEESQFMVDGISQTDPLTNKPHYQVNLDAIQEVSVVTGGFSAKYGNLRSGYISVVTKEGGQSISASANIQYSPPALKHFGPMMFEHSSPVCEPYVQVWDANGNWDPDAPSNTGLGTMADGKPYSDFFREADGWNTIQDDAKYAGPHFGKPIELYARWLWRHRSQDSIDELKKLEKMGVVKFNRDVFNPDDPDAAWHMYGVKPDYKVQATLGGPIPFVYKWKPTTFFLSFDSEQMEYTYRPPQRAYLDYQFRGKITSMLNPSIKLQLSGYWSRQKGGAGHQGPGIDGNISNNPYRGVGVTNKLWYPNCAITGQQTRQNYNLKLIHSISPKLFYDVSLTHYRTDYDMLMDFRNTAAIPGTSGQKLGLYGEFPPGGLPSSGDKSGVFYGSIGTEQYADSMAEAGAMGWDNWRDWAQIKIGDLWYDESPKGYGPHNWRDVTGEYRMESCQIQNNFTFTRTYELDGSIIAQLNRYNQIEAGFEIRQDKNEQIFENLDPTFSGGRIILSNAREWKGSFYLIDKLEFPGFIANLGLRADWLRTVDYPILNYDGDPNNKINGPYSDYLLPGNTINEGEEAPNFNTYEKIPLQSKTQLFLSPRLGISHPISTTAKVFFNFGHMYQWESLYNRYRIAYNYFANYGISLYGNPLMDPPRTIQFELGYEHNLFNKMSLRTTFYYKDINNESRRFRYYPSGFGNYRYDTFDNGTFRDIAGLESFLELRPGFIPYFNGWISFNYMSEREGDYGYDRFYEDPERQTRIVSAEISEPDVRPTVKLNLNFYTPSNFGPSLADKFWILGGINVNLLYFWQRGPKFTWNPAKYALVENNLRWTPYSRWDFRLSKDLFTTGKLSSVFYIDIRNIFNTKNLTRFTTQSFKKAEAGHAIQSIQEHYGYSWAWDGHRWWKNERRNYLYSLGYSAQNQNKDGSFNNTIGQPGSYKDVRIDLPAFTPMSFLEKRDIWFGFKIYF